MSGIYISKRVRRTSLATLAGILILSAAPAGSSELMVPKQGGVTVGFGKIKSFTSDMHGGREGEMLYADVTARFTGSSTTNGVVAYWLDGPNENGIPSGSRRDLSDADDMHGGGESNKPVWVVDTFRIRVADRARLSTLCMNHLNTGAGNILQVPVTMRSYQVDRISGDYQGWSSANPPAYHDETGIFKVFVTCEDRKAEVTRRIRDECRTGYVIAGTTEWAREFDLPMSISEATALQNPPDCVQDFSAP